MTDNIQRPVRYDIRKLNQHQHSGRTHPFTCGRKRTDEHHLDGEGILLATPQGWMCPYCDYRQKYNQLEADISAFPSFNDDLVKRVAELEAAIEFFEIEVLANGDYKYKPSHMDKFMKRQAIEEGRLQEPVCCEIQPCQKCL